MISWEQAELLEQQEFAVQLMLALSDAGITTPYHKTMSALNYIETLSDLTYIDVSQISAWFTPNDPEPLPQRERHHLWLAVYHRTYEALNKYRSSKNVSLRRWTDAEDEVIINNYKNMSCSQIGKLIVRTASAVRGRCKVLGIYKRNPKEREGYSAAELLVLADKTLTNRQVADKLERPIGCIWMKREQMGINLKDKGSDGI